MILRSWAERLLHAPAPPDVIDLHVQDVVAALFVGLRTHEGHAMAYQRVPANLNEMATVVACIARLSECDDIHLASCVTPGAIVVPIALAFAADHSADTIRRAVATGYAAGIGLGTAIGGPRALTRGVWPTLFAAPVMAAATASCLMSGDPERLAHAIALALPCSGVRIVDPALRWMQFGMAVSHGIRAAEAAHRGEHGDLSRLPDSGDPAAFENAASIATVGFKPFPIARQGANAVVALQRLLAKGCDPRQIESIEVFAPETNTSFLKRPVSEDDRLSRLCNMGLQLAGAALAPELLDDSDRTQWAYYIDFPPRVTVTAASDLESHWPDRWPARVVVVHTGGQRIEETVIQAPFDHDAPGLPQLLQEKWRRMLSPLDLTLLNHGEPGLAPYATLWHQIERRLRTPAED
jgi:2-methylcitrate dehydratase PrpD